MPKQDILFRTKKKKAFALLENNQLQEARAILDQLSRVARQDADIWCALGVVHGRLGDFAAAITCCRRAAELAPRDPQAQYNLAIALRDAGQLDAAAEAARATLALNPAHRDAVSCLGHLLIALGRAEEAVSTYQGALAHHRQDPRLLSDLGTAQQFLGQLEAAVASYQHAIQLAPDLAPLYDNLASVLCFQGRIQEALNCSSQALRRDPRDAKAYGNYLLTLHYMPGVPPEVMLREHKRWPVTLAAAPDSKVNLAPVTRSMRRLRVGYVSADFRNHSVAYFLEPLIMAHDRGAVEVYCYSNVALADATTVRFQALADQWRPIAGLTDEQAAAQIRADDIDILVDLGGHTSGSRLALFARKLAPTQVTYLGYPDTTGLATIDYRITDAWSDPPGAEAHYTETLIRLDGCFLCYRPPEDAPPVATLPALQRGFITFGSCNARAKINEAVIKLWSRLLQAIPTARLLLKNPALTCAVTRDRLHEQFMEQGIARERVELRGLEKRTQEHLATYAHIDIALDTFPYNGTTTTCEAMWMGVPVVTLAGDVHAARVGMSLLHAVGQESLVGRDPDEYLRLAMSLAGDRAKLTELRMVLRQRMTVSPLCEATVFARKIEAAYYRMTQVEQGRN
jgi:predicted O-linked N-acetylglucosamine transferase (SPINDLY family)